MTTIKIEEFRAYSVEDIHEYLCIQEEKAFEIRIDKSMKLGEDIDWVVGWEYEQAAYIGQLLSEIGRRFTYFVPCQFNTSTFRFEFSTTKYKKLAEIVKFAIDIFYCTIDGNPEIQNRAFEFRDNANSEKADAVCWGLLKMAERIPYEKEEGEED